MKEARANGYPHTALANQGFNGGGFCIFAVKCTMLARLTSLRLPTLRGFVIERARQGTFRGFCTERARLGTFSGLGTERERRLKEARAYRLSHCYNKIGFLSDISTFIILVNSGKGCLGVGGVLGVWEGGVWEIGWV